MRTWKGLSSEYSMRVERLLTRRKPPRRPVLAALQLPLLAGSRGSPGPAGNPRRPEDELLRCIACEWHVKSLRIGTALGCCWLTQMRLRELYYCIKVTVGEEAPRVVLRRLPDGDGLDWGGWELRVALVAWGLLDNPYICDADFLFSKQRTLCGNSLHTRRIKYFTVHMYSYISICSF